MGEIQSTNLEQRRLMGEKLKHWWRDAFEVCEIASCVSEVICGLVVNEMIHGGIVGRGEESVGRDGADAVKRLIEYDCKSESWRIAGFINTGSIQVFEFEIVPMPFSNK